MDAIKFLADCIRAEKKAAAIEQHPAKQKVPDKPTAIKAVSPAPDAEPNTDESAAPAGDETPAVPSPEVSAEEDKESGV